MVFIRPSYPPATRTQSLPPPQPGSPAGEPSPLPVLMTTFGNALFSQSIFYFSQSIFYYGSAVAGTQRRMRWLSCRRREIRFACSK